MTIMRGISDFFLKVSVNHDIIASQPIALESHKLQSLANQPLPKSAAQEEDKFPMIKYGFAEKEDINDSNEKLYLYRKVQLNKQGIEAARNPFDIPKEERETAEFYEQFIKTRKTDDEIDYDDFVRVRRKILVGSYSNSSVDEDKLPSLLRYVWKGKIDKLTKYIKNKGKDQIKINKTDKERRTALHFAASWKDDKMLELLLSIPGINVNATDQDGKTSLRKAVEMNALSCVKLLILHGANPELVARDGRNPFEYAIQELGDRGFEIISYLYNEGGMYSERKTLPGRVSYLHQVCMAGKDLEVDKVAEELLLQGASVNPTEGNGKTPLILAAERGKAKLVQTLLEYYPDILHVDMNHKSAIDYTTKGSKCYSILKKEIDNLIASGKALFGVMNEEQDS